MTAAATTRTTRAASLGHGTDGRFIHQRTSDWISDLHANRRRGQGCALRTGLPRRMGGARTSGHSPRLRNLHTTHFASGAAVTRPRFCSSTTTTPSLLARRHAKTARPPAWRFVLVEAIRARALRLRVSRYAGVLDRPRELGWGTGSSVHAPPFARCDAHFVDDLGGSQRYVLAVRVSSRVRLSETWRVLGRRDDLGALEAERRLLASGLGKRTHSVR